MIYDGIDFTPPAGVREEAARALAWRREFGRGGTEVGIARGRDLSNGTTISPDTARRMVSYFARHEVDKQGEGFSPGEPGFPSNGRIAWGLWGGDPGQAWSEKLVRQMDAREASATNQRSNPMNIERRTLLNTAVSFPAIRVEKRSEEVVVDGAPQKVERDWCVGYASVFGLLSLDLGDFVERIDSRAFDKVLARRGDDGVATRALWNHNSDYPLGRHPETLVLTPDEKGLRYEFPFGRASYAQDLRFNIDDGIVKGSSFGFVVAPGGERWSKEAGRNVRTVMEIEALYDVSPTTYPAYPDSDVAVAKRSFHHAMESGLVKPLLEDDDEFMLETMEVILRAFDESKHPRAEDGKFGGGGGGSGGGSSKGSGKGSSAPKPNSEESKAAVKKTNEAYKAAVAAKKKAKGSKEASAAVKKAFKDHLAAVANDKGWDQSVYARAAKPAPRRSVALKEFLATHGRKVG